MTNMDRAIARGSILREQSVRTRRNLKDMGFLYLSFIAAFIIVMVVFIYLWTRLTAVNLGYEISKLNEARAVEIEKNKRLRLEIMELTSPERVEKTARQEFSLDYPRGEQVIHLK